MRHVLLLSAMLASAASAADVGSQLPRPVVAVIDSGVARTPELSNVLIAEYDTASAEGRTPFQPRYDHGTMVATILARAAKQQVDIVSIRIDDPAGCPAGASPPCQPSAAPVAAAIRKATSLGVTAINLSLNLDDDPSIVEAVREASRKGIRVVMAAGNSGWNHPTNLKMARAGYPLTTLVGALDPDGNPWVGTNRPEAVTKGYHYTWQRGVAVPTVRADGMPVTGTGTSFAAPIETARLLTEKPAELAAVTAH